ncbi:MAG: hypothetical protein HY673_25860 [Chloroflexi bacterium]|nr:hypothetical protein [Chloroflexota bacterium]
MIEIERKLLINASAAKVWTRLTDVPFVASCMPGVEKVAPSGEGTYDAVLRVKVAYISAVFDIALTIVQQQKPVLMETLAEGNGRLGVGRVNQRQLLNLRPVSENETEATYKSELLIVGKLAAIGRKVITTRAHEMADQFARAFAAGCETE